MLDAAKAETEGCNEAGVSLGLSLSFSFLKQTTECYTSKGCGMILSGLRLDALQGRESISNPRACPSLVRFCAVFRDSRRN